MTRHQHAIVDHWVTTICRAIALGADDAAYRITRAFVCRCREIGLRP